MLKPLLEIHLNFSNLSSNQKVRAKGDYLRVWKLVLTLGFQIFSSLFLDPKSTLGGREKKWWLVFLGNRTYRRPKGSAEKFGTHLEGDGRLCGAKKEEEKFWIQTQANP